MTTDSALLKPEIEIYMTLRATIQESVQPLLKLARLVIVGVAVATAVGVTSAQSVSAVDQTCAEVIAAWTPVANVYSVETIDQLYCLGTSDGSSLLGESFLQAQNLLWSSISVDSDVNSDGTQLPSEWSIIGADGEAFTGTYDGGAKSISGLSWNHPEGGGDIGMFGVTSDALIKNLSLTNITMVAFGSVGALAGRLTNGTEVNNVQVSGVVGSGQNEERYVGDYVGGIAGTAQGNAALGNVLITHSSFDGTVTSYGVRAGGAVGYGARLDLRNVVVGRQSSTSVTVSKGPLASNVANPNTAQNHSFVGGLSGVLEESTVDSSVFEGTVTGKNMIGGIVGRMSSGYIKRTTAAGTIRGRGMTGGIVGWADYTQISDVASSATVALPLTEADGGGSNANFVGGIAGLIDNGGSITRAINTGSVTGYSYVGGIAGSLSLVWRVFDPLGWGGANGAGRVDESYSIGTVTGTYANKITGAIVAQTDYETDSAVVRRSIGLADSAPFTVDRGASFNRGVFINGVNSGTYLDRLSNPFKTSVELQTLSTFASGQTVTTYEQDNSVRTNFVTGWNVVGTNGVSISIVNGWYSSVAGFGPYWGMCPNYNSGYPFLLALTPVKPDACDLTTQTIAPEAPYDLSVDGTGNHAATIRFVEGATYGLATILGYQYEVGTSGVWNTLSRVDINNVNAGWAVAGLANGAMNSVKIRPILSTGTATSSQALPIELAVTAPDAPTSLNATLGDGQLSLAFTAGIANGPTINNYMYSLNNGESWTVLDPETNTSPLTITGLARGATYNIKLRAMNSVYTGGGEISEVLVVTMPDVPSAPTDVVASVGDSQVSLAFTAGPDNGSDISRYEYQVDDGSWVALSPAVTVGPIVITGLTNGVSYSVRIRAVNAVGDGVASEPVTFTPLTVPSVVRDVVAAPGDGRVSIAFSVPADSGGSAITNFEYQVDDGSWVALSPAVTVGPIVITGLTNGVSYSVRIRAVNAVGDGVASEPVTFTLAEIEVPSVSTETPAPVESVVLELPTSPTPLIPDTMLSLGEPVTLEFGGFVPGEFVQLIVASTPRIIGSGYADSEGKIRLSGSLPTDLAAGEHSLALYAPESGRGVRQPITIEVSLLPATGTSPLDEVMVMLMLVIVGSCFLMISRNRRTPRNLQRS